MLVQNRQNSTVFEFLVVERKISDFFFERIVPVIKKDKIFLQRETNRRLDHLGVDAVMAHKSKIEYVDLKHHAFFHVTERHPDYAFELETGWRDSNNKKRHSGWFVNKCKVTEVYGFLFWDGIPDNVENMRVCLIRKQDIIEKLTSMGIDMAHWEKYISGPPKLYNGNHYWFIHENIRITKSMSLPEQPLNLIVPWYYLKDIVIFDKLFRLSDSEIETAA